MNNDKLLPGGLYQKDIQSDLIVTQSSMIKSSL